MQIWLERNERGRSERSNLRRLKDLQVFKRRGNCKLQELPLISAKKSMELTIAMRFHLRGKCPPEDSCQTSQKHLKKIKVNKTYLFNKLNKKEEMMKKRQSVPWMLNVLDNSKRRTFPELLKRSTKLIFKVTLVFSNNYNKEPNLN